MKGRLRLKQEEFVRAVWKLLAYAESCEMGLTFGDAYRDPRCHGEVGVKMGYGHAKSVHKMRLAIDLNAIDPKDHEHLHDYWDTLGGAPRIPGDNNHYSFSWEGMR